jgi:hypothetical protein
MGSDFAAKAVRGVDDAFISSGLYCSSAGCRSPKERHLAMNLINPRRIVFSLLLVITPSIPFATIFE